MEKSLKFVSTQGHVLGQGVEMVVRLEAEWFTFSKGEVNKVSYNLYKNAFSKYKLQASLRAFGEGPISDTYIIAHDSSKITVVK